MLLRHCAAQRAFIGHPEKATDTLDSRIVPAVQCLHSVLDTREYDRWKIIVPLDGRDGKVFRTRALGAHRRAQQNRKFLFRLVRRLAIRKRFGPGRDIERRIVQIDQQIARCRTEQARNTLDLVGARDHFAALDLGKANIGNVR